jgi:hypothetical protein
MRPLVWLCAHGCTQTAQFKELGRYFGIADHLALSDRLSCELRA